jgi:signal transduction histidine kinase
MRLSVHPDKRRATTPSGDEDPWGLDFIGWDALAAAETWPLGSPKPTPRSGCTTQGTAMRAWLVHIDPARGPLTYELGQTTVIGRGRDCTIVLARDGLVSRAHAELNHGPEGLWLTDLGSQNGTFVNGERVQHARLRQGDILMIGQTRLAVRLDSRTSRGAMSTADDGVGSVFHHIPSDPQNSVGQAKVEEVLLALDEDLPASSIDSVESQEVRRRTRAFLICFQLSQRLQSQRLPEAMIESCLDTLLRVLPAMRGQVIEVGPGEVLRQAGARTVGGISAEGMSSTLSEKVCRQAIRERCGVLSNDPQHDFSGDDTLVLTAVTSIVCAPMIVGDRVNGLIELVGVHPGQRFDEQDLELLTLAASMLGTHLEARRLELQRISTIERLQETQRELERAQEQLLREQRMVTLGKFASKVVHEMRIPLAATLASVEPLPERYPDDSELHDDVQFALKAIRTAAGNVEDLDRYAKAGADRDLDLREDDLVQAAEDAVRYLRFDRDMDEVSLRLHTAPVPRVPLDLHRITQVVINLVRNAAHATTGRDRFVSVHVFPDAGDAVLEVRDNGCGMGLDIACRAWQGFYTTKGEGGMGVGLEICRLTVEQHQGDISFRTWPGHGTTFQLRLYSARAEVIIET